MKPSISFSQNLFFVLTSNTNISDTVKKDWIEASRQLENLEGLHAFAVHVYPAMDQHVQQAIDFKDRANVLTVNNGDAAQIVQNYIKALTHVIIALECADSEIPQLKQVLEYVPTMLKEIARYAQAPPKEEK